VLSFLYWLSRRLLELLVLRMRSERVKEIEILVLRHQLQLLECQVARPQLSPGDRALLAAFSRALPRSAWASFFVTPATLLRWHNTYRPHRALNQQPPLAKPPPVGARTPTGQPLQLDHLRRRERLGGLLHEYELAA